MVRNQQHQRPKIMPNDDFIEVITDLHKKLINDTDPIPPSEWDGANFQFRHLLRNYHPEYSERDAKKKGIEIRHMAAEIAIVILSRAKDLEEMTDWLNKISEIVAPEKYSDTAKREYLKNHDHNYRGNRYGYYISTNILYTDLKYAAAKNYLTGKISEEKWTDFNQAIGYETPLFLTLDDLFRFYNFDTERYFRSGLNEIIFQDISNLSFLSDFSDNTKSIKKLLEQSDTALTAKLIEHWDIGKSGKERNLLLSVIPESFKNHFTKEHKMDNNTLNTAIATPDDQTTAETITETTATETPAEIISEPVAPAETLIKDTPVETIAETPVSEPIAPQSKKMFFVDFLNEPQEFNRIVNNQMSSNKKEYLRNLKELVPPFSDYMNRIEDIKTTLFPKGDYFNNNGLWLAPWLDSAFQDIIDGNVGKGVTEALELRKIAPLFYTEYMIELFRRTGFLTDNIPAIISKIKEYQATLPPEDDRNEICETATTFIDKPTAKALSLTDYSHSYLNLYKLDITEKKMLINRIGFASSIIDVANSGCSIEDFSKTLIAIGYGALPALTAHWMAQSFKNISEGNIEKGVKEAKLILQFNSQFFKRNISGLSKLYLTLPSETHAQVAEYIAQHPEDASILSAFEGKNLTAKKVSYEKNTSTVGNIARITYASAPTKTTSAGQKSEAAKEILGNFFNYAYNDTNKERGLKNMMLLEKHYPQIFENLMTEKKTEIARLTQFEQRYLRNTDKENSGI